MSSPRNERVRREPGSLTPHSLEMEQAILGGVLVAEVGRQEATSNPGLDAVTRVGLKPEHFYEPVHAKVFDLMLRLGAEQRAVTIFSLKPFLEEIEIAEGVTSSKYLAMLAGAAITAVNLPDYAKLVIELARRRLLIDECGAVQTDVVSATPDRTTEEMAAAAMQRLQAIAESGSSVITRKTIGESAASMLAHAKLVKEQGIEANLIPTGFRDLDRMTGGFEGGTLWVMGGRPGMGKVHPLDLIVETPAGRRSWGSVKVDDLLFGRDGSPTKVLEIFPNPPLQMFRVTFDDGSSTEVGGDHLWNVRSRAQRVSGDVSWQTLSTFDLIAARVKRRDGGSWRCNFEIPDHGPAEFAPRPVALDSYLVGVWIGDGTRGSPCYTKPSLEIAERLRRSGYDVRVAKDGKHYRIHGVADLFRDGVFLCGSHERFIPDEYKFNSVSVRRALFEGLCDTDGEVYSSCSIGYSTTSRRLAEDVVWLARSLGCKAMVQPKPKRGRYRGSDGVLIECRDCWRVTINASFNPFTHTEKRERFKVSSARYRTRWIDSIEPTRIVEGMCVRVAAPDHLYLANDFIVTHNTSLMVSSSNAIGRMSVRRERNDQPGWGVHEFSLEVTENQLMARHVADLTRSGRRGISFGSIMRGDLADDEMWTVEDAVKRFDDMPIVVDYAPRLSVADIAMRVRAEKARFARQNVALKVVFLDYLKMIKASDRYKGQRVYEVGEITGALKALAKAENICIVLLCQLNRANEARDDKRPGLADLRESGDIEADADVVCFLHREAYYIEKSAKFRENDSETLALHAEMVNQAELIIAKNRAGPTRTVMVYADIGCSSLGNLYTGA